MFFGGFDGKVAPLWLVNLPPPTNPLRNKRLIAGLIKGNQWLISPDHKALFCVKGGLVDLP